MSNKQITISVPERVADKAMRAVHAELAESISAYFAQLADREPDWAAAQYDASDAGSKGFLTSDEEWVAAIAGGGIRR